MKTDFKKAMPYILLTLLLVLLVARLLGFSIAWYWIISPLWIPIALIIFFTLLGTAAGRAAKRLRKKQQESLRKAEKDNKCKNC